MKRKLSLMIAVGVTVVVCLGATVTHAMIRQRAFRLAGERAAQTQEGGVYVLVNGIGISQGKIDRAMETEQLTHEQSIQMIQEMDDLTEEQKQEAIASSAPPTREEVEQRLVREAVLLSLAQQRGIVVTEEEARAYVNQIHTVIESQADAGEKTAVHVLSGMEDYAAGMGITYEEYKEEIVVPIWREELMRRKLEEEVLAEVKASDHADAWEAFVEQAIAEAEIIYP